MEKKLSFSIVLPPEIESKLEEVEKPEHVLSVPATNFQANRGKTLLVVVSSGDKVDRSWSKSQAREFVEWMRGNLPGYFYEEIIEQMKYENGGSL